ncbi:MAG: hypothetical protein WDW36_007834 [Sanguina aurantia]
MLALLGPVVALGYLANTIRRHAKKSTGLEERSTTSSAGGGAAAYETRKAVDEYVQFHFGADDDVMPYAAGPHSALDFPARCAALAERHCTALQDFNGEGPAPTALDIGCAVGGSAFALARAFTHVLGIDYSHAFVAAAQSLQAAGSTTYEAVVEGDVRRTFSASIPSDIDRTRVRFEQGDACQLSPELAAFDAIVAANLLCRLPDPRAFLADCPRLVKPGGILVLVSPHSWLPAWTPKERWVGGYVGADGAPVMTTQGITAALEEDFELVEQVDMPFLIREHARKFQWGCSNGMVWRRRA